MELTVINPPKKKAKSRRKTTRKRKWGTPAQRAALAKGRAARRRSGKKTTKKRTTKKAATRRTTSAKKRTTKKRTNTGGRKMATRRKSTSTRKRRSYSRRGFSGKPVLMAAASGTAGVLLAQQVLPRLPLPENMRTPMGMGIAQVALGVAIATLGRKLLGKHALPMGTGVATIGGVQIATAIQTGGLNGGMGGLGYLNNSPALLAGGMGYLNHSPAMDDGLGESDEAFLDVVGSDD